MHGRIILTLVCLLAIGNISAQEFDIWVDQSQYFIEGSNYDLDPSSSDGQYNIYSDSLFSTLIYTAHISSYQRTGTWTYYFKDGKTKRTVNYSNDMLHGEFTTYYPSGQVSAITNFSLGDRSGSYVRYYETGETKLEGQYMDGQPSGIWKYWSKEGQLLNQEQY